MPLSFPSFKETRLTNRDLSNGLSTTCCIFPAHKAFHWPSKLSNLERLMASFEGSVLYDFCSTEQIHFLISFFNYFYSAQLNVACGTCGLCLTRKANLLLAQCRAQASTLTALSVLELDFQSQSLCGLSPSICRYLQTSCFNYVQGPASGSGNLKQIQGGQRMD